RARGSRVPRGRRRTSRTRPGAACRAMQRLLRDCHEPEAAKPALRRRAWQLFRALVARRVVEFLSRTADGAKVRVNVELQDDFSMDQTLSLYLLETLDRKRTRL